jgi:hypothetical protein
MATEEQWELVKARIEDMPSHMKISIGNAEYDKEDIIEHVEKRDDIGKLILEVELNYLKALKEL